MAMAVTGDNELLELFTHYNEDLWPGTIAKVTAGATREASAKKK